MVAQKRPKIEYRGPATVKAPVSVGAMKAPVSAGAGAGAGAKLSKRVGWLNSNAGFPQQIQFSEVQPVLQSIGEAPAMQILKLLEEQGSSVRNPTAWLKSAAQRVMNGETPKTPGKAPPAQTFGAIAPFAQTFGGVAPSAQTFAVVAQPAQTFGGVASAAQTFGGVAAGGFGAPQVNNTGTDDKVRKRVGWMNAHVQMHAELNYNKVGPVLNSLTARDAMELLKQLEEKAAEVKDPSGWVANAAKKKIANGGGVVVQSSMLDEEGDQKIRRRIGWLNANAQLAQPLMYNKVKPELMKVGLGPSMEILKEVEENAADIRDPSGYVVMAARRLASGESAQRGSQEPPQEKLRKRLEWLNTNGPFNGKLNASRIGPVLMNLEISQAMQILKNAETNAATIGDPNTYVAQQCQGGGFAQQW